MTDTADSNIINLAAARRDAGYLRVIDAAKARWKDALWKVDQSLIDGPQLQAELDHFMATLLPIRAEIEKFEAEKNAAA